MFGLRKILGSVFLVIVFLALATLATFFYNADQAQKDQITKNELFQKGQETAGALLGASLATSETMADANLQKNIGLGKTMADMIGKLDWQALLMGPSSASSDKTIGKTGEAGIEPIGGGADGAAGGFWSNLGGKIANEWDANQAPSFTDSILPADGLMAANNESGTKLINYQKTDTGGEIIISPKNGAEYKVDLPFKFLSRF